MNRLWLLVCTLLLAIGCGGGGGGGGAAPAPNPSVTPPTAPSGVATIVMSATSIRVTWTDNSSNEDGFTIEYLIPPATVFQTAGTLASNATQFAHSGLAPSTTYVYRVKATNAGGSTISTNQGSGTTSAAAVTAPAAPTTLIATAASSTQINLAWTDNASNEDGFKIEQSTTAGSGFTQITTVGANVVATSVTGLTASTQYYFRIRAYNTATSPNSAYSNTANATTQAATPLWVLQTVPAVTGPLHAIAGNPLAPNDLWAVGKGGVILHYNGSSWTQVTSGTTMDLLDVRFKSGNVFTVVGYGGTILTLLTLNGVPTVTAVTSPTTADLSGLFEYYTGTAWAVGQNGIVLKRSAGVWQTVTSPTTNALYGVGGWGAENIWVVGGSTTIFSWDGVLWKDQLSAVSPWTTYRVQSAGTDRGFIVGSSKTILYRDGTTYGSYDWRSVSLQGNTTDIFTGLDGDYAVGHDASQTYGFIFRRTSGLDQWTDESTASTPPLYGVTSSGWAVGGSATQGTIVILHRQ